MKKLFTLLLFSLIFVLTNNKSAFSQCTPSAMLDSAWAVTPTVISPTLLYDTAFVGQVKVYVLALNVSARNCSNTIRIDSIFVSTTGSTAPSTDIAALNVYNAYAAPFNDPSKISTTALPNGKVRIVPTGGWTVALGVNTLYVAYDLSITGIAGHVVDCSFDSLFIGGYKYVPKIKNPVGYTYLVNNSKYNYYCGFTRGVVGNYAVGIRNVTFGTINNSTGTMPGPIIYDFYPKPIPTFYKQVTYPISITTGELNSLQYANVYIDWNNDGYFTAAELAYSTPGLPEAGYVTGNITIPCNASPGIHRMRVTSDLGSSPGFCGNLNYGECEDYLINIAPEGTPVVSYTRDSVGYIGGRVTYTPQCNIGGNIAFRWDIDNNGIWDTTMPIGLFTFNTTGYKTVRMQAVLNGCNSQIFYSNIYIDSVLIMNAPAKTLIDFISDQNTVTPNIPAHLTDLSTYGPYRWKWKVIPNLLNGVTTCNILPSDTVKNPTFQFTQLGTYNVQLKCTNKMGVDSLVKLKYISVVKEMLECHDFTTTLPNGFLYDDGGKYANYSNPSSGEQWCDFVIHPNCAIAITLSFDQFDVDAYRISSCPLMDPDWVKPFDGRDSTGIPLYLPFYDILGNPLYPIGFMNQLGSNVNLGLPPPTTATSGYMCVQWHRNCAALGQGFEAKWSTQLKPVNPPHAAISAPDTVYTGTKVYFHSTSVAYQPTYQWDFNNDNIWEATDSADSYSYATAGTYIARLAINSCQQLDTAAKTIIVRNPATIPVVNFTSDYTRIATKNAVHFTDLSDKSVFNWRWRFSPNKVKFIDGTDSFAENPHVMFTDTGFFSVTLFATNEAGTNNLTKTKYIYSYNLCIPAVLHLSSDLGMSQVTLTDINNNNIINNPSTIGASGYTDYSNNLVTIYQGATYQLNLKRITSLNNITWNVWIDYNQNGKFENSELVGVIINTSATSWTTSITIPNTAYTGFTYMRIAANTGALQSSPCGPNFTGEFEDYGFIISQDNVKPVITLNPPDTIVLSSCGKFVDPGYSAWDPVFGTLTSKVVKTGSYSPVIPGIYPISYNVKDTVGNTAITQIRYIKILTDIVPPTIRIFGKNPDSVSVTYTYTDPGHKDTDDCSGIARDSVFNGVNVNKLGTYNIYYTTWDKAGNVTTAIRKVVVYDNIDPKISLKGANPFYIEVHTPFVDPGVTILDNYWMNLVPKITGTVDTSKLGTYFLTYSATDSSGNGPVTVGRTVVVQDKIPPTITLLGDTLIIVDVFTQYYEPGYTVHDNYYSGSNIIVNVTGSVNNFVLGDYHLFYQAVDASNNKSVILHRTVRVVDRIAPTIQLNGLNPLTLQRWAVFKDDGVTATDNYYAKNKLIYHYNEDGTFENTLTPGIYSYTYQVCDPSNNCSQELTRTIIVVDNNQTLGMNTSSDGYYLNYYPNPANNILNVDIGFDKTTNLVITVYDAVGKQVMNIPQGELQAKHIPIDISNLSSGIYSIRFTMGTTETTRKLIITK